MAESMVTELVKIIAEKVSSEVCRRIAGEADIDSQIKGLNDIKNTLEATLLDADSLLQVCSQSQRDVIDKLERGLAKLIDFQDAKAAKAKQKQLMVGSKLTKETRLFFSASNQLVSSFKDARKIKVITEELSLIARNHEQFGSIVSSSSLNQTRTLSNVSGSYMSTDMVIGRDGDRDKMVISLLLDSSNAAGILSVAPIVGMGGVGKTTLAQYVYGDERIKRYFDLQLWVFVTQHFSVKSVLQKIVACVTREQRSLDCEMDQLQRHLFQAIAGKRFLLVLDGVWDEDNLRTKWLELRALLRVGAQGSQVFLTTRSNTVAKIIGTQDPYLVDELGDDDSWSLFRHVATTEWHEPGVESIGKEIAKMCPKVPLVIQAIGSVLAGKYTVREWRAFRNDQLKNFASYGRDVIGTLKLSYDQLGIRLRLCVAYCSLFPKGFLFRKSILIHLWIAMGYVEGEYTDQSLEEVAEGYVLCLLNRGFFKTTDDWDGFKLPKYFWMNSLMHDFVLSIAGFKYKMVDSIMNELDERVCHVSFVSARDLPWSAPSSFFKIKQLKSFLLPLPAPGRHSLKQQVGVFRLDDDIFISKIQLLRVLRMHGLGINKLPRSLGKLIHLRYLDFSHNTFRKLPDSITQLVNLYFLDLSFCWSLEQLPDDISKLLMLRHLNLQDCNNLSYIPKGLRRLTGLETLYHFVVGKPSNSLSLYGSKANLACSLADLSYLENLKGWLTIVLVDRSSNIVSEAKAANLNNIQGIKRLRMRFKRSRIQDEMVLENLKPCAELKQLFIENYAGTRFPCWMREQIHLWLPNLVTVEINGCQECIYMCSFGRLPHLKHLILDNLDKVQYIENDSTNNNDMVAALMDEHHPSTPLFPSLTYLTLRNVPQLKGWRSVTESTQDQGLSQLVEWTPTFPKLEKLDVEMEFIKSLAKVFPQGISSVGHLIVFGKTTKVIAEQTSLSNVPPKQIQPVILLKNYLPMLQEVNFSDDQMEILPEEFRGMTSLERLDIYNAEAFEAVPKWIDSLTCLKRLTIYICPRLKMLPSEISNLSNLKSLILKECSWQLAERCLKPSGEDWPKIQHIPNIVIEPLTK